MGPYDDLPPGAFWRTGVQQSDPAAMPGIYQKKFDIAPTDRIATAGSCFAQHIARHMKESGFTVVDVERPPIALSPAVAKSFGFELYSARYGNIYTARQLLQLFQEAIGKFAPADVVWEKDGRFYDAMRPGVEPEGLDAPEEVLAHRKEHLKAVFTMLRGVDLLVFTFGLTEAWIDAPSGTVYPTAPGTIAGAFDLARHVFKNFSYPEIYADFVAVRHMLKRVNANMKFLVTVSPVPLTATASGKHVLQATTYSKSVLRAVAGHLAAEFEDVDYFPSYEIIMNPANRSSFFESNLRSVAPHGVAAVMKTFFAAHQPGAQAIAPTPPAPDIAAEPDSAEDDVVCEEMLLDAFARR
jgi:hypothetical protein